MRNLTVILLCIACLFTPNLRAKDPPAEGYVISGPACRATFSRSDGAILSLREPGAERSILHSGESGLWQVEFEDESTLNAADFDADSAKRRFTAERMNSGALRMRYSSAVADVEVVARATENGIEFESRVRCEHKTALELAIPGRLRFDPKTVRQFICPTTSNVSVGVAFNSKFFQRWPDDPGGWSPGKVGSAGYRAMYGGTLNQRPVEDSPVAVRVTAEGQKWLDRGAQRRVDGKKLIVNRAPTPEQVDLNLIDSPHGPYLSACSPGGEGYIWRIGALVRRDPHRTVLTAITSVVRRLVSNAPDGRTKLGLVALKNGPNQGAWTDTSVEKWRKRLEEIGEATPRLELMEIKTARAMVEAAESDRFLAILNPYGEWLPVPHGAELTDVVENIKGYVRRGGNWFEVGGYSFFQALRPDQFLDHRLKYPPAFADFMHLDSTAGSVSIYGVQPHNWKPWEGRENHKELFVPGRLACGGDEAGGYCRRAFGTYVAPGQEWDAPAVRLDIGRPASETLRTYCRANGIERGLEEKMSAELLDRFKDAVMVKYHGNCSEMLANLTHLPTPSIVHMTDYLRVGFDEPYPDHLPPRPEFGTPEEFRSVVDKCHELGHLFMPYVNPTWWCDNPRSPTFAREGTEPLLKGLDGELSREVYGGTHDGYTVCHWHPAVRKANRETVQNFTEKYPSDILLQDQCGARSWKYDTNPESPTPYAYSHGLMSMVAEDSTRVPLSTESGWDGVVNYESQLCGMSWGIVPYPWSRRPMLKTTYPTESWTIYPIAQYIAHEKCAMIHHDLGQFVHDRQRLAWTLGLGFCMSYRTHATRLSRPENRQWPAWLSRVQKSLCARYLGQPVRRFEHTWGKDPRQGDDGVIRAQYGDVSIIANLNPHSTSVAGRKLPAHGFHASAPGMAAGDLQHDAADGTVSFLTEWNGRSGDIWVLARPARRVAVPLPGETAGTVLVKLDHGEPCRVALDQGRLDLRLPEHADASDHRPKTRYLWHARVEKVVK